MPRPNRRNADYFPHPARPGRILDSLQRRWGNDGYAIYWKVLELLTDADEHYLDLSTPDSMELFIGYLQVPPETINQVMTSMANLRFIDPDLWYQHRAVWCEQLVDSMLAEVYRKRGSDPPEKPETAFLSQIQGNPAQNTLFLRITAPETPQKESIAKEVKKEDSSAAADPPPSDDPKQEKAPAISLAHPIVNLYHGLCTGLPKVVKMTEKRKAQLRARMREHPELEWWEEYLGRIADSTFLNGSNERGWRADFEFITSESGMVKILEGKYDRNGATGKSEMPADIIAGSAAERRWKKEHGVTDD